MFVHAANPALIWPDTNKFKQAMDKLDFLVAADFFMTDTAKMADIVLPSTTFWEGDVLKDYTFVGLPLVMLANKVVEPLGECMEDWRIWVELGKRMGYGEYFPWRNSDEYYNAILEPSGITVEKLRQNPAGIWYGDLGRQQKYLEEGLASPSGKVELYSETLEKYGYDPLPDFVEPIDHGLVEEYPLVLVTGARMVPFTHSRYRNVNRLRKLVPYPTVEINTDTARGLGIENDGWVVVASPNGSIRLRARITDNIHPGVVSILHGWEEANANVLTDGDVLDPISGYPAYKAAACRISRD
jgi:anaerobic selenocysteine-containing dehydrogenase